MASFASRALFALATLALVTGCETTSNSAAASSARASAAGAGSPKTPAKPVESVSVLIPASKVNALQKGMTGADVTALLGRPHSVQPFPAGELKGEVWTYRIQVVQRTTQVAAGMRDVPGWDPISNIPITIKEPILQNQYQRRYQTLQLLMVNDHLTERKPGVEEERSFD